MTETCATCRWSIPAPARMDDRPEAPGERTWERPPIPRRRCHRMPQPVVNDADYCCGEYMKRRTPT